MAEVERKKNKLGRLVPAMVDSREQVCLRGWTNTWRRAF